ncbi:MAG: fused MFS/spermidine synthase [Anaerohalosphaeraceae bacterium]|nr:fused MFS/spermidine synthase [Anaerohalosphaeraceae bacterium]
MSKSKGFLSILIPSATVFLSSACIMIIELVASRLIARHLGSSLYTWTAVIGVVLAGITIGNYAGGRIADKFQARKTLATIFVLSSVACVAVVILNNLVGEWIWLWKLSWPVRVFSHVSLVFFGPAVLLGTISPVVAKMALDKGLSTGRTIGDIYAWGAAGSIFGTFLAGFYLIPTIGTTAIIWSVATMLLVMGILYWVRLWPGYLWAIVFVCALLTGTSSATWAKEAGLSLGLRVKEDPNVLYEDDTPYCHVAVRQLSKEPDHREFIQDKLRHSEIIMGDVDNLQYFYSKIFAGITHGLSNSEKKLNTMIIGGGGYAFPQYLEKNWPGSQIDVVEIDPGVTKAATEAFGLSKNTTINTYSMDARNFVDELLRKKNAGLNAPLYDFVYEDAINDYSVPFQLVTREFNEKMIQLIKDDGVYIINMIDTYNNARFLGALVGTIKQTFPNVYVVTNRISLPGLRDTYVIIASKRDMNPKEILNNYGTNLKLRYFNEKDFEYLSQKSNNIILTDNYAPVENLLAPVVRQSSKELLARKYLTQAKDFRKENEIEKSIEKFTLAAQLNPSMTIKAYNEIAMLQISQNNLTAAIKAFKTAIDYHKNTKGCQNVIGTIYLNLGTLYQRTSQRDKAAKSFKAAIKQFNIEISEQPDSAILYSRLGDAHASMGDLNSASKAFAKALKLEPTNPSHLQNLIKALEFQGKYDEAIKILKEQIKLARYHNKTAVTAKLQQHIEFLKYKKSKQNLPK